VELAWKLREKGFEVRTDIFTKEEVLALFDDLDLHIFKNEGDSI